MSHTISYRRFVSEMARISANAHKGKPPALYNLHKLRASPFEPVSAKLLAAKEALDTNFVRVKSELYDETKQHSLAVSKVLQSDDTWKQLIATSTPPASDAAPESKQSFLTDIPLPKIILRHVTNPSEALETGMALGKITGFRIQVKGRRGTRSVTNLVHYGSLGAGDIHNAYTDFGRSLFITKRGVTGVKVWVGYAK
ncbi:uncharacterized protein BJ171DRAFT_453703 [Polychytrium aggregatum]|uniref:uncharacterized protein n=1 Tax=Polychytrium aggregatum TaxID=110093 RepID=UPI0022FDDC4A|nr:uncharacterized protein BJ171DRAFT_453703 [Polychytrium aggregatum]KAI9209557.1 hypothetical protein BJ171DRAFT_453703 [Polychytrium aggregatum]